MKKQISRTLLGFFAVLMLAAAANAQTSRGIEVQIPFDFVAGKKQLPAGHYTVRRIRFDSESVLLIRGEGKGAEAVVLTNSGGEEPTGASLTFRQHGERYFLAEVSIPGTASVRALTKTRAERELVEQAKHDAAEPKTVTIAGSMR
jgi:hypothetical protein